MTTPVLHYIHDPLCGWCYAAAPLVDAAHRAGVKIAPHGGGLWATPAGIPPAKVAYIRQADARIGAMTGQPFGAPYLDGLLGDPATVLWSQPVTDAVLAAGRLRAGADLDMLHAVQVAHYVEGRRVVEAATLAELAGRLGLDRQTFAQTLDPNAAARHIAATRGLMARAGVQGFPGFLLDTAGGTQRLAHEPFYGRPVAFVAAVRQAVDHAARRAG